MPSLVENLKSSLAKSPPTSAELTRRLEAAQSHLADLEAQHGDLALESLSNVAGADAKLKDLEVELSTQRTRIRTLRAATNTATEREEAALAAQRLGLQKTQRRSAIMHLAAREKAAHELTKALTDAALAYRNLMQHSAKATQVCHILTKWSDASLFDSDLEKLVKSEMYRLSANPNDKIALPLPGAAYPTLETQWNPTAIKPLLDQIKEANARLKAKLDELGKGVD